MADQAPGDDGVFARRFRYLDTHIRLSIEAGRVERLSFHDAPPEAAGDDHQLLDRIDAYLTGTIRDDFDDVPVALGLPERQVAVLEVVRTIPYGESRSVRELLRSTPDLDPEDDADHDLVREALDANPVPLLVPDHRVRDGPSGAPPPIEQRLRSLERIVT